MAEEASTAKSAALSALKLDNEDSTKIHDEAYETKHVHDVYERIADHFSGTRYKPWPIVSRFLSSLPAFSVGLDIGCGNGKYLIPQPDSPPIFTIASDRSPALTRIASSRHPSHTTALVADVLSLPHPPARFDFAICIAVIHHLSTRERRVEALGEIAGLLRPGSGKALVYVWALEQKGSRRGWDVGDDQDVLVPWVTKEAVGEEGGAEQKEVVYQRFYHLYREGELQADVVSAGGSVIEAGYEKDNWWAIIRSASDPP